MWANDVMRGIGETLHAQGYHLLLYGYREAEGPSLAAFLDGRNDGLIILAPHEDDTLPMALALQGHPMVIVGGRHVEGERACSVDTDQVKGAGLAVQHLLDLGHRKIGLFLGPPGVPNALDRKTGFEQALTMAGFGVCEQWIVTSGFSVTGGRSAMHELWSRPERPTALCAANDESALGVLEACAELGIRVPEDLSIVGYDDAPVCRHTQPNLTSVRQPAQEMGAAAAERLLAVLGGETEPKRLIFQPTLSVRKSSGMAGDG
jgi:DNA-binding LacI/PurR family transcriptional regulator